MHAHFSTKITCSHLGLAYTSTSSSAWQNSGKYQRDYMKCQN